MSQKPPQDDGILVPILTALMGGVGLFTLILIGGITFTYLRGPSEVANLGSPPAQTQSEGTRSAGSTAQSQTQPEQTPEPAEDLPEESEPPEEIPPTEAGPEPEAQPPESTPEALPEPVPEQEPAPEPKPQQTPQKPASTSTPAAKPSSGTASQSTPDTNQIVSLPPAQTDAQAPASSGNNSAATQPSAGNLDTNGFSSGQVLITTASDNNKNPVYHTMNCRAAKKISPEDQDWFDSATAAEAAGRKLCGWCAKGG